MYEIKHHLTEDLLMGYSAGSLPEAFNLVIATHVSMCDDCRAAVDAYDAVGGELLLGDDTVPMHTDSLSDVLAQIAKADARPPAPTPAPAPAALTDTVLPSPVRAYLGGDLDAVKWRKIGGGVSQMIIPTSNAASVRLLRIPAGMAMPDHGHNGTEMTLVLQGAFVDASDRFDVGDVEVANEDMNHTPVAAEGADCICLTASDAPLEFKGILPKIAQRFFRI